MRGTVKFLFAYISVFLFLVAFADAAEPVRLAYSEKMGVTIFAYPDDSGQWCRAKLGVSILIKDGSPLLTQGIDGMLPKFGAMFGDKCAVALSASVAVYKASDRSLVEKPFTVAKADNWRRAATVLQTAAAPEPDVAPSTVQCDHSLAAGDYFVAACVVRGLEASRQSDGLDDARARQVDAAKSLQCVAQSMTRVTDVAYQAALRIVGSAAISPLMDFADGLRVECKKAAAELLK